MEEAEARGIKALAINQDTLAAAARESPARDLWKAAAEGEADLLFFSPEMLQEKGFNKLIHDEGFLDILTWFWVDEAHLTVEWGRDWRESYRHIGRMRNRLPSRIAWGAWSATIAEEDERRDVLETLGFRAGEYFELHLPTNRPEIQLLPRTLLHSISGNTFQDYDYLIPMEATSMEEIPGGVMCWCETIDLATRFIRYLDSLIPSDWQERERAIMPLHSLMSPESRKDTLQRFKEGKVRILVSTNCGCVGLHLPIKMVVLVSMVTSFALLMQWIGRAGRYAGAQAKGICYGPDWLRLETEEELRTMSPVTLEERRAKRAKLESVTVAFWNPTPAACSRRVACEHYGDEWIRQEEFCCGYHDPRQDSAHRQENSRRLRSRTKVAPVTRLPQSNRTHHPLNPSTRTIATTRFEYWRIAKWPTTPDYSPHLPSAVLLPDSIVKHLADKLHIIISRKVFNQVMVEWEYLAEYGEELFRMATVVITQCDEKFEDEAAEARERIATTKATQNVSQKKAGKRRRTSDSGTGLANPNERPPATPARPRVFGGDASSRIQTPTKTKRARGKQTVDGRRRSLTPISPERPLADPIKTIRGRTTKPQARKY